MKIAVVGNLCQIGYILTKQLRSLEINTDLYITCKDNKIGLNQNPWDYDILPAKVDWIKLYNTRPIIKAFIEGKKIFSQYDKVIALTLSPSYIQFFNKNYYCIATGSDIREFAFQKGIQNFLLNRAYKKSRYVFMPISEMSWVPKKLGIENKSWIMATPVEADKIDSLNIKSKPSEKISIFYPTNWITTKTDRGHKGSEKFINACSKLFDEGYDFSIRIIDQNQNSNITKEDKDFVNNFINKYSKNITLIPRINKKENLVQEYKDVDIITDQFDLGIFGVVGLEAMCCKKALLTFFSNKYSKYYDNVMPPILNCENEQQIYETLKDILTNNKKDYLSSLGNQAFQWVSKYHDIKPVAKKIVETINAF